MAKMLLGMWATITVVLGAPAPAASVQNAPAARQIVPIKAFLCDSADHAIQFADVLAKGEGEEVAKDQVGRKAKAEVCGRYVGRAAIETEKVMLKGGVAYKLTAYRFQEDKALAWLAETTFAPPASSWTL